MFGRESYSKEAYKDLENQIEAAKAAAKIEAEGNKQGSNNFYKDQERSSGFELLMKPSKYTPSVEHQKRFDKVQSKLQKMFEAGHGEASELNQKYDQLIENAANAQKELETFEEEQLGKSIDAE